MLFVCSDSIGKFTGHGLAGSVWRPGGVTADPCRLQYQNVVADQWRTAIVSGQEVYGHGGKIRLYQRFMLAARSQVCAMQEKVFETGTWM
jgi:hypothetical protein